MMLALGFVAGVAATMAVVIGTDMIGKRRRAYAEQQRSGYAIIRTRHRRSERYAAPLPLDMMQVQLETCGHARAKRIGGRWR